MSTKSDRRDHAVERMADHLLAEGLASATLRPLAAAAGTSDRMLLYHFADKNELLAAIFDRINERMMRVLDEAIPTQPRWPFEALLGATWRALSSDDLKQYMPLWLDLAAGSARGLEPHRTITGRIADGVIDWVTARLVPGQYGGPSTEAPKFLAIIEGLYLITAFDRGLVAAIALEQFGVDDTERGTHR